jgi:choline-sulfatase
MKFILLSLLGLGLATPPNIIFLQTDSMDGRLLDSTSDYYLKLKSDGFKSLLVDNGANFIRQYTNSPQCVPSRTSMMTSRYVHELWTTNNGQGLARSTLTGKLDSSCVSTWNASTCELFANRQNINATLLDVMRMAGYQLHVFGRFDTGAGILDDYPHASGDGFHEGANLETLGRGSGLIGKQGADPLSTTSLDDPEPYPDDMAHTELVLEWLRNNEPPKAGEKPLFLWLGLLDPHPPYVTNSTWEDHVNQSAIDTPPKTPVESMHPFDYFQTRAKGCDNPYTDADIKKMRSAYWGACAEALGLLESVLTLARKRGFLNNTFVVYTSDHGEMSLEHLQVLKNSMYEPSSRVPLIITPFGVPDLPHVAASVIQTPTSLVDLLPTLAELAAYKLPFEVRGQSLVPFLKGTATPDSHKAFAAMQYHSNFAQTGSFALRQGDLKLITFGHSWPWFNATTFPPLLFNLTADPFELTNIAPGNPAVVSSMVATLEQEFGVSLAQIDQMQMTDNLELYNTWFFEKCTGPSLLKKFMKSFGDDSSAMIQERVLAWSGKKTL